MPPGHRWASHIPGGRPPSRRLARRGSPHRAAGPASWLRARRKWRVRSYPNGGRYTRAALLTTEHENVAVRIAHFELPVTVGLSLQRHLNKCSAAHRVVQRVHAPHPDIRVPEPFRASGGEFRLLVPKERHQLIFPRIKLQPHLDERVLSRKRPCPPAT